MNLGFAELALVVLIAVILAIACRALLNAIRPRDDGKRK